MCHSKRHVIRLKCNAPDCAVIVDSYTQSIIKFCMVQYNDGIQEMQVGDFEQCPHRFPEVDIRYGSGVSTESCEDHAAEAGEVADYEAAVEEAQRWQNTAARGLAAEFWDDDVEAHDENMEPEMSLQMELVDEGNHNVQEAEDDDLSSLGFVPTVWRR